MSNFSEDFDDNDDELTDSERQSKYNIAQEKAKHGRFDGDDSVEDLPNSAVTDSNRTSRD